METTKIDIDFFVDLLNGVFAKKGSGAVASAINGKLEFLMDGHEMSYPVNMKITIDRLDCYFFVGGPQGGPLSVDVRKLTTAEESQKFLLKEFERVTAWQLSRTQKDDVRFYFISRSQLIERNRREKQGATSTTLRKATVKAVPPSMQRPRRPA
ncbi:MAG: hypothetical protein SFV17_07330 [Candidatus Obscuribacter sp.]|nr:hypothetical protein [Candidatus Obscuribacter sp.]